MRMNAETQPPDAQSVATEPANRTASDPPLLWTVHLARRRPERLPTLAMVVLLGACCAWLLFRHPLPALAAMTLLLGSAIEYLLPVTYRIDNAGISARSALSCLELKWSEARRCLAEPSGLLVSPLPTASRLDRFRGILLRYAPDGEPGDRRSALAAIAERAPGAFAPEMATTEPGASCLTSPMVSEITTKPSGASPTPLHGGQP
jgi:hypothetical protein